MTTPEQHPATKEKPESQNEVAQKESILSNVELDFKVESGKLILTVTHEGSDAGVKLDLHLNSDRLLDKLEAAIPGDWDKGIIMILKSAIANVKI